jgi:predicted methyltransferase
LPWLRLSHRPLDQAHGRYVNGDRHCSAACRAADGMLNSNGEISLLNFGPDSAPLPAETFDFILSTRCVHGWLRFATIDKVLPEAAAAPKPGGILAIEQHRAPDSVTDIQSFIDTGYVSAAFVIEQARKVGLELVGRSEINANPLDTKDRMMGDYPLATGGVDPRRGIPRRKRGLVPMKRFELPTHALRMRCSTS